jgi:hypothetical protein
VYSPSSRVQIDRPWICVYGFSPLHPANTCSHKPSPSHTLKKAHSAYCVKQLETLNMWFTNVPFISVHKLGQRSTAKHGMAEIGNRHITLNRTIRTIGTLTACRRGQKNEAFTDGIVVMLASTTVALKRKGRTNRHTPQYSTRPFAGNSNGCQFRKSLRCIAYDDSSMTRVCKLPARLPSDLAHAQLMVSISIMKAFGAVGTANF